MSVCVVIQSGGIGGAGGSDPTPSSVNWDNISSFTGTGQTNAQTISGTDQPIYVRAAFTLSGSTVLVTAYVNGAAAAGISADSADEVAFYAPVDASIIFEVRVFFGAATGTFTVTNVTDSNTQLDTFTYYVEK